MTIEYRVPDVPLFRAGGAAKVIDEEMRRALNAGVLHLKGAVLPLTPVNIGTLRQGVQTSVTGEAASLVGRVFDPVAYAIPVEMGSRPHFPPVAPLQLWVRRKLGITDEREAHSVAFLICRSISRRGTKAVEMFRRAFEGQRDRVAGFFEAAQKRIVARLVGRG